MLHNSTCRFFLHKKPISNADRPVCVKYFDICFSSVLSGKFLHKDCQLLHPGHWHRIVDGGAHTTDTAVALEGVETALFGLLQEPGGQAIAIEQEGNVHDRTMLRLCDATIEVAIINHLIQTRRVSTVD